MRNNRIESIYLSSSSANFRQLSRTLDTDVWLILCDTVCTGDSDSDSDSETGQQ